MATIYDVARQAGVSPKTVSRVLNDDAPVAKETRKSVVAAMDALRYVPSRAARSMKSTKSNLIGLITGAISNADETITASGLPELFIVQGAQQALEGSGKTILISDTGGCADRVPALVRTFQENRVEGLIYVTGEHKPIDVPLPGSALRTVLVNCFDHRGTPSVLPDDEAGQYALTEAVIAAGHRRIAYLTLGSDTQATRLRMRGFRAALDGAGVTFDDALVHATDRAGSPEERALIQHAVEALLALDNRPTAICCGNDRLAMTAYGILRQCGVAVPEAMSVVGYDDHRVISEGLVPALTTAELPYNAMGARAARMLLDLIESSDAPAPETPLRIQGRVKHRGSLIAPLAS